MQPRGPPTKINHAVNAERVLESGVHYVDQAH